jgi:hypothetical protein
MQVQTAVKIKDQFTLIQPYANRVKKYRDNNNANDFIKFFEKNLLSAIKKVHEEEVIPAWVKDLEKYWERSEILICSTLLCDMIQAGNYTSINNLTEENGNESKISAFVHAIYYHLKSIAMDRNWNLSLLHYQIFRDLQGKIGTNCIGKRHCEKVVNF